MTTLVRPPLVTAPLPTTHSRLLAWVREVAELTRPAAIRWCDGSAAEWEELTGELVRAGTLIRLNPAVKPNSFYTRTDPTDVARVEDRTFICSRDEADSGPTNNWVAPEEMKATMTELYRGSMRGRTMYVLPFCMGPLDADQPMFGVEITDSAYVAISMGIMTRMGSDVLAAMSAGGDAPFVPCLHSVGHPLEPGEPDLPWPCNETKYISHFPEERMIWSYGSGYGGNSLLGKKCYSLRIASAIARDEGWLAEHMLILKLTSPAGKTYHLVAAFPSACGKTNLAMLEPTIPGWQVETLGDDIAWMRFGSDGRLYAVNPEYGFFGVAPGTGWHTNPNAMRTIERGNSLFTNVALTNDGDVWWEGQTPRPPSQLTDWMGRYWTPDQGPAGGTPREPAAHPNSRFCTPIKQCPILSEDFDSPTGVPIDAILFGGRRATTVPLVAEARDWAHGVFLGATLSSETTAAATGKVGVVRRDPMAMLPFLGYNVADYFSHWLELGKQHSGRLPQIFYVNWFRKKADGTFLWPGFGENGRVLKWAIERMEGTADAVDTPVGLVPAAGSLDVAGLHLTPAEVEAAVAFDADEWRTEVPLIEEWFDLIGERIPTELLTELDLLKSRLDED
ncbi:phosphoenolpyruvate carboxykinase (GTP) [Microlunatus panaciterrae]|uniref:Phosphoenolpyruvate carboxykinase [GTP] n=1 Tax=Microlunatus panaciterrae TaxID=400768 RepID=A0ABS2RK40_9ACTN|nr:phosphoenolpyruvate carboxykinase (GTP) [Microlunatus panaciterrae]MBM7799088.1 phosphoenolpyruvate carboxykinase (GTP) [Microlunatus panaciterrae]